MAYKVVLIDDNPIIVESLLSTVHWEKYGLHVVGCANDGKEGAELICKHHPEVVITDIYMPEVDGLTMIERLQDELRNARIIFITGFDKFQYASRAIKLSAFDFILKPIDSKELADSLERVVLSLDQEQDREGQKEHVLTVVQRTHLLAMLAGGGKSDDGIFWKGLRREPERYFFIAAESEAGLSRPMLQRLDFIVFPENLEVVSTVVDGELILFCGLNDAEITWQVAARNIADALIQNLFHITVAISAVHTDAKELHLAYRESRHTLLWHTICGRHANVEYFGTQITEGAQQGRLMDIEQFCTGMAQKVEEMDAETVWEKIYKKSKGRLRIIRLMLMFFCTRVIQDRMCRFQWADDMDMTVYDITKLDSVGEAENWLNRFVKALNRTPASVSSALVRNVIEYVRGHVTEGLVLSDVAAQFYVSPNYLSALIRKETGLTYRQHVINAKISLAKHMLDDTRMRVEDIAYAIGYENYISFYNVFKKQEKQSPTEYRFRNKTK